VTSVLIVEDDPGLRRALAINLRARDYTVTSVAEGRAALSAAAASPPDVVILDLGLPDMDGTEVIEGLRGWSRIPIIVLSARQAQGDKGRRPRRRRRRLHDEAVRHERAARAAAGGAAPQRHRRRRAGGRDALLHDRPGGKGDSRSR
jgi:CheY-like chemotaxis protein